MIRMVVADRSETMRLGVRALFKNQVGDVEVSEATSRSDLITQIEEKHFNLLVLEPLLCGGTGDALIRQIRRVAPSVKRPGLYGAGRIEIRYPRNPQRRQRLSDEDLYVGRIAYRG